MGDAAPKPKKTKSIALAIMLNALPLVIFGVGYIYIGKWIRFLLVEFLQLFSLIFSKVWGIGKFNPYFLGVLWVASIIDVLIQTAKYNEQNLKPV
jgi:TM2 domain-containing membrane protein YozV